MREEFACTVCLWVGIEEDLEKGNCPYCGADVEWITLDEYLPYQKDFNWNKK